MMVKKIFVILLYLTVFFAGTTFAGEQVYFYHTDPVGTPIAMIDSNGTVVWKADYKPFGEEDSITSTTVNSKRFLGKEKDEETGLNYFGVRYLDAKVGRFISPDPVRVVDERSSKTNEKMLVNPQRLNMYAYALNNPYRYVDPNGRDPYLPFSDKPNSTLLCHVNPHFDRDENFVGGIALAGTLISVGVVPELLGSTSTLMPNLGSKLEYFLGNATGNAHNIARSNQMLQQLERIGLSDSSATRQYLTEHLTKVLNDSSNVVRQATNGRTIRESILMGPKGGLKFETVWENGKLITGNFFGGPK